METSLKKWFGFGFLNSPSQKKTKQKTKSKQTKNPPKAGNIYKNLPFGSKLSDSLFLSLSHGEPIHNSALGRKGSRHVQVRWATSAVSTALNNPEAVLPWEMGWEMYRSNGAWWRPDGSWPCPPRKAAQGCSSALGPQSLQTPQLQTTFLLGVCPHTPHRTTSAACGRKPKIMTVNPLLYLRTIPGNRLRTLGRSVPVTQGLLKQWLVPSSPGL